MHHLIFAIIKSVFGAGGSQVSFLKEKYFHVLVNEHPDSDVKFPTLYQHRVFDVFLDYELVAFYLVKGGCALED